MRKSNMTVEEMRQLNEMLTKRLEDFTARKEERVAKLLANPADKNIENQLYLIHDLENKADDVWKVIRELKFDIEDITGEPEA